MKNSLLSSTVYAQNDNSKVKEEDLYLIYFDDPFTAIEMLKTYDLSVDEIEQMTVKDVRKLIKDTTKKRIYSPRLKSPDTTPKAEVQYKDVLNHILSNGYNESVLKAFLNSGYTSKEIYEFSKNDIETAINLLSEEVAVNNNEILIDSNLTSITTLSTYECDLNSPNCPNTGYLNLTCISYVYDESHPAFASSIGINESNVLNIIDQAELMATNIFLCSTAYVRSGYFIYGEYGGSGTWIHEGNDMQYRNSSGQVVVRSVYNHIFSGYGKVIAKSSDGTQINVYDSLHDITLNYQHLSNCTLSVGAYLTKGQKLGEQNLTDRHIHIQVMDGYETSVTVSGTALSSYVDPLYSIEPYYYINVF